MDYVIVTNNKKTFIRLNNSGSPITCGKNEAQCFEYSKARNIADNLPKTLKKFHFKVQAVPEIPKKKEIKESSSSKDVKDKKVIQKKYVPSENVTRWVEKFGTCDDILKEAVKRKEELSVMLSSVDKELVNELHIIELESNKNACQGFLEYKRMKVILEKRREIKDEMMIIRNVISTDYTYLSRERVKKSVDNLSSRKFTLRVIDDVEE